MMPANNIVKTEILFIYHLQFVPLTSERS